MLTGQFRITTDHQEIKLWLQRIGGKPAKVKHESGKESYREISWEEFFEKFDAKKLAFLYLYKTTDGNEGRFFKFINREGINSPVEQNYGNQQFFY